MILRTFFVRTDFSEIDNYLKFSVDIDRYEGVTKTRIMKMYGGNPDQYEGNKGLNLSYVEYSGNVIDDNVQKFEEEIEDFMAGLNRAFNINAERENLPIRDLFHFQAFSFPDDDETVFVVGLGEGEPKMDILKSEYTFM